MGYRKSLLFRWSRRDRLTVIVVAVTAAFLIGTTLLLFTAVTYSETFAEPLSNSATVTYQNGSQAPAAIDNETIVIPMAEATIDNRSVQLVGIPPDVPRLIQNGSSSWQRARLPEIPTDVDGRGPVSGQQNYTVTGASGQVLLEIVPHAKGTDFFAPSWYVTNASTIQKVGTTGHLLISDSNVTRGGLRNVPQSGVPLVNALLYVLGGLSQILRTFSVAVAGGSLLILIVVYSVTRMSIADRAKAIRVIRSTGAPGWRVGLLFVIRASLLVTTGVALGYAIALILSKALVNAAIYLGLPIALDVSLTTQSAQLIGLVAGILILMGIIAGLLAVYPVVSKPPAKLGHRYAGSKNKTSQSSKPLSRVRGALSPTLLSWRSIVPTAATLAVFALTVLLVISIAGVAPSISGDTESTGTITQEGAPHPLNSRLDADYANTFTASGIPASPEIIYAQVRNGVPYMIHGARYTAFANVTNATLRDGVRPTEIDEAVIGNGLSQTLDVGIGDTITIGGSVSPGIRQVEIVGRYDASRTLDDLLIIPLESAWGLATRPGTVHMIRVAGRPQVTMNGSGSTNRSSGVAVTGLTGPQLLTVGDELPVEVTIRNFDSVAANKTISIRYQNETRRITVSVPPQSKITANVTFEPAEVGQHTVQSAGYTHTVRVGAENAIQIPRELPSTAPPGSGLYVAVASSDGKPASNVSVSLNRITLQTDDEGVVVLPVPPTPGNYTIRAQRASQTVTHKLRVVPGSTRQLAGRLRISPQSGNVLTSPTLTVYLGNPWQESITRQITVDGPGTSRVRTETIKPGNITRTRFTVARGTQTQPGTYTFELAANGTQLATVDYTVTGDERLASAVASSGQFATGTTIERSVTGVFGNVQIIFVALVVLAALSTIGSTAATFAQGVHVRKQAIGVHRSTGATRGQVLKTVLNDVMRIALPATLLGLGLAVLGMILLESMGLLIFFGFRLASTMPAAVLAGVAVGSLILSLLGAIVATVPYLFASPVSLLSAGRQQPPTTEEERSRSTRLTQQDGMQKRENHSETDGD
jgi:ABC-type antimicrobial peptide transport system permease subunit